MKTVAVVAGADSGRRLDRIVQAALGDVPPSLVQRLLRQGKVRLNGRRARAGDRVAAGDQLEIHHPQRAQSRPAHPPPAPLPRTRPEDDDSPKPTVLHADASYVLLAKPAGLTCQPPPNGGPSLLGWVEARYAEEICAGAVRPAVAHRLDRDTTGVVAVALTARAMTAFHRASAAGAVRKLYLVAVWGRPALPAWRIALPLVRHPHAPRGAPKVTAAGATASAVARPAVTRVKRLALGAQASLLLAEPVTGRTHQIRAHLAATGLPVVGDPRYGNPSRDGEWGMRAVLRRQLLHAVALWIDGDAGSARAVAPLPADTRAALRHLGLPQPELASLPERFEDWLLDGDLPTVP